jgi:hypothetical protein
MAHIRELLQQRNPLHVAGRVEAVAGGRHCRGGQPIRCAHTRNVATGIRTMRTTAPMR